MRDFKKYLKDGRRVAAFGKQIGNEVEVFLLYCSKKDQFSKKYAKSVYQVSKFNDGDSVIREEGLHPVIFRIPIKEGDSAEYTFKVYMRDNFYRMESVKIQAVKIINFLTANDEVIKYNTQYAIKKLSERSF